MRGPMGSTVLGEQGAQGLATPKIRRYLIRTDMLWASLMTTLCAAWALFRTPSRHSMRDSMPLHSMAYGPAPRTSRQAHP